MAAADDRASRARVREFVRTHHPDVGGDPAAFAAGLAALRAAGPAAEQRERAAAPVTFVQTTRLRRRLTRVLRQLQPTHRRRRPRQPPLR